MKQGIKKPDTTAGRVPDVGWPSNRIFMSDSNEIDKWRRPADAGDEIPIQDVEASTEKLVETPSPESQSTYRPFGLRLPARLQVMEQVGEGGMGSVYRVRDSELDRTFAIKVIRKELLKDKTSLKRFEQEARGASYLTHPNLVSVYGHDRTEDGVPYLMMDYHEGVSLEELISREGKLDQKRALNIFLQVTEAVQHAHDKGIVHRDLKPSNIFLSDNEGKSDFVKVLDFGIAKMAPPQGRTTQGLTAEQEVFGSPLYMSPEQARGFKLDARSDIYSLGCVMYESLTGRPPFEAENPIQTLMCHVSSAPPAMATEVGVHEDLQLIVLHCLEKERRDRYQTMSQLKEDLTLLKLDQKPKFSTRRKTSRKVLAVMILLLMASLAAPYIRLKLPAPISKKVDEIKNDHKVKTVTSIARTFKTLVPTWILPYASDDDPAALLNKLDSAIKQSNDRSVPIEQRSARRRVLYELKKLIDSRLMAIGPASVKPAISYLSSSEIEMRRFARKTIEKLGPFAVEPLVSHLMTLETDNSDPTRQSNAIATLASFRERAGDGIMAAFQTAADPEVNRAMLILAKTCARVGAPSIVSEKQTEKLASVLEKSESASSRRYAAACMSGSRSEIARRTLKEAALHDSDLNVRVAAISAIGTMAAVSSDRRDLHTLSYLMLNDSKSFVRYSAAVSIAGLGTGAGPLKRDLQKASNDPDDAVSMVSRVALVLSDPLQDATGTRVAGNLSDWFDRLNRKTSQEELRERIRHLPIWMNRRLSSESAARSPSGAGFLVPSLLFYTNKGNKYVARSLPRRFSDIGYYASPALAG